MNPGFAAFLAKKKGTKSAKPDSKVAAAVVAKKKMPAKMKKKGC